MSQPQDNAWELDPRAVRAAFQRATTTFAAAAVVHEEARQRLLERLDWVKLAPTVVLDVGCALGEGAAALAARYPAASVLAVDSSIGMLERARVALSSPTSRCLAADAAQLPLPEESVDLLFANLLLPWLTDLPGVFGEWQRVLKPGGLVVFTSLGPDTLYELAKAWAVVEPRPHVHGFFDMHDLGDALVRSGLQEPVLDVDHLAVTYPSVAALAKELKACGGQNATRGRRRGLTGKQRWAQMVAAYPRAAPANPIEVTVELVFGQAWGGGRRVPEKAGVTAIDVADIKRRR